MLLWDQLGGEQMIAAAVPEAYASYRAPIAAAVRFFVESLPGPRAIAILAEQMVLGPSAGASERLMELARSCPVLHKLGQVLARDRRLDPGLRAELQRLESMEPEVPMEAIRALIEQDLGPLEPQGLALEPTALAEASVAVVVPFRYREGSAAGPGPGRGVFKVLKPGIEERLDQELALLEDVGAFLDERCAEFGIPPLDYQDIFAQVRERLGHEVRLDIEQRHLASAREAYEGWEATVRIPRPLPWSSRRITAMERIDGRKVTEGGALARVDRGRLARRIVEALIAHPLWSTAPSALFHADPHAGNLLVTDDGRLGILDWSLAGTLGKREREAMGQVLQGALMLDARPILEALRSLSSRAVAGPALEQVVAKHLRPVGRGHLPGFTWMMGLLDEAVQEARLRVGADLMMFRRVLLMLEGVLADVEGGGGPDLDAILIASFVRQLVGEWPGRALALPRSRAFGTHLSNADLMQLALTLPWTTARVGLDWWQEVLAPGQADASFPACSP
ncbi:MAG: AarF/ABC1/UbiB kinase family protein [Planctomycetaceae bacterium]|nr:AarF/ABC1/UbiB kinase family protein [Planctomycetaceae bacterium]